MRRSMLLGAMLAGTALLVAAGAEADVKVGVTAAVNPQAIGQPPTEPERMLLVGSDNFANEKITTGPGGQAQLLFLDGSALSVGPDANITIDQYVYDTKTKLGKFALTATQGVFRLVGGAISKTDEIVITTPVATAGIRGGIVNVDTRPGQPLTAQFLFGTKMRVTANGVTQEATRPGFGITVVPGQPPGPPVRLTTAEVRGVLPQFQGKSRSTAGGSGGPGAQGTPGGTQEAPQDQALDRSNLSSVSGSNDSPQSLATLGSATQFYLPFNPNTNNQLNNVVTQAAAINQTTALGATTPTLFGHFYCCQPFSSFNPQNFFSTPDPSNNFTFSARVSGGDVTFTLPVSSTQMQTFTLPFVPGTSTFTNLPLITGSSLNGTLTVSPDKQFFGIFGNVNLGPGQSCGGESNCKFGLFAGVPTPQPGQPNGLPTSGISTYSITPIFDTLPFVHNNNTGSTDRGLGLPGQGQAGVSSSPMFVAWSPVTNPAAANGNDQRATWLQSSLVISGSGGSQQSALIGATGSFFQEQNSTVAFAGGVTGMARTSAGGETLRVGSSVSSAQIQTNTGLGNAIYGPNGEIIVASTDNMTASPGNPIVRNPAQAGLVPFTGSQPINSGLFVNALAQNAPDSAPTQTANSTPRTDQVLTGFTSGILDSRSSGGTVTNGAATFNGAIGIATVPGTNRMQATMAFSDSASNSYVLNFGSISGFNDGRSSYINDRIFAARDGVDNNGNPTSTINGSTAAFSRMFMVSAATVPIDFQTFAGSGVTACTCSFMQWGWWVGEVRNGNGQSAQRFNLATWVAGTPAQAAEIAVQSGTATFNGHYVANVATLSSNYVAAGNFTQNWNFGTHSGTAQIANFDRGGTLGTVSATASLTGSGNAFAGMLSGTGGLSGPITGLFYKNVKTNDPIAGVGGTATMATMGYKAAGTFAACRAGTGC